FHLVADGVAMDDDETVVGLIEQERLADPSQVGLELPVELDAGANARMDEEIIPEPAGIGEGLEELHLLLRNRAPDHRQCFQIAALGDFPGVYAIASQAFLTAEAQPARKHGNVALQDAQQDLFVVAEEEYG